MTKTQKLTVIPAMAALLLTGGAVAGYAGLASAQVTGSSQERSMRADRPHVHGTVSAISGSTITIAGKDGTTYTIDASGATVKKFVQGSAPVDGTLADIAVGDEIGVKGTVSGTSVTATEIMDGVPPFAGHGKGPKGPDHDGGRGVMGTVSAINGSTITLTGPDGQTFTVDAGSATVHKVTTGSLSDISVGDRIGVQGTVSGNSVTAKTIMDGLPKPPAQQ